MLFLWFDSYITDIKVEIRDHSTAVNCSRVQFGKIVCDRLQELHGMPLLYVARKYRAPGDRNSLQSTSMCYKLIPLLFSRVSFRGPFGYSSVRLQGEVLIRMNSRIIRVTRIAVPVWPIFPVWR